MNYSIKYRITIIWEKIPISNTKIYTEKVIISNHIHKKDEALKCIKILFFSPETDKNPRVCQ